MIVASFIGLLVGCQAGLLALPEVPSWVRENCDVRSSLAVGGSVAVLELGSGTPCRSGQIATLEFIVLDAASAEVATSFGSRLPLITALGQDPLWDNLTLGMRKGELRRAIIPEERLRSMAPGFAGGPGEYTIRFRLVQLETRS